jgi:hypothetical protein
VRAPRRWIAGAVAALALLGPGASRADDMDAARALFVAAKELGEKGLWKDAARVWEDSLKLYRAPLTLYSLGLAQSKIGLLVEARDNLRAFLEAPPSPKSKELEPEAHRLLDQLAERIPTIAVVVEPSTVLHPAVTIDGKDAGGGSLARIELDPGPHEIAARAPGWEEKRAQVILAEGDSQPVTLVLAPSPPPLPPPPEVPPPAPTVPRADAAPPPAAGGPRRRVASFALMGAGGAVFVTGLAVGLTGVAQAHSAPGRTGPDVNAAKAKALAGDVVAGCGIAAFGVGLILLLTSPRPSGAARRADTRAFVDGEGVSLRF